MSTAAPVPRASWRSRRPAGERPVLWALPVAAWLPILAWLALVERESFRGDGVELLAWGALVAAINLLPLKGWQSALFAPDIPVATALALLFSPVQTGVVLLFAAWSPTEVRGETTLLRSIWNRGQISLAGYLGSLVVHLLDPMPAESPYVIPLALLALLTNTITNYGLVGFSMSLIYGSSVGEAMARLKIGTAQDFVLAFLSWGAIGAMMAVVYKEIGWVSLPAFVPPALLGRQALVRSQMFLDKADAYRSMAITVTSLAEQMDQERSDERRMIAADLHDEVLPAIFQVALLAHVVRNDLSTGRLLEAEPDAAQVVKAAEEASEAIRNLIGDLRKSPLGRGGLASALIRLVSVLKEQSPATITSSIDEIQAASGTQLAMYQIAKEALSNAIHHSRASSIHISLTADSGSLFLQVRDDGTGFDPLLRRANHYGLFIMRERASSVGGTCFIDSDPGRGTEISVVAPSGLG